MPSTTLTIDGFIDLAQFWPVGESDADTTKIEVTVRAGGFKLQRPGQARPSATTIYERAYQLGAKKGAGREHVPLLETAADGSRRLTARLQRVDAPELHVTPGAIKGKSLAGLGWYQKYRQRQAETAVAKMRTHLLRMARNNQRLECRFVTELDDAKGPGDAIDKYGRFVGDLLVGARGENLNLWLLEQGWAIVALYESMQAAEIDQTLAAWRAGAGKGIRRRYRAEFEPFEFVVFRAPGAALQNQRDDGPFIHPKYFRRYVTWWAFKGASKMDGSFTDYLVSRAERVYRLAEFRAWLDAPSGSPKPPTYALYDPRTDGPGVSWGPEEFIFKEAPAPLYADIGGHATALTKVHWDA
jgi:endonuclease YncB( thermonuclease family)